MLSKLGSHPTPDAPHLYEIKVRGNLGEEWTDWFGGLTVAADEQGNTILKGEIPDQAALYGLLARVRDLGLPLLSVNCLDF